MPRAARNVKAIAPPTSTVSASPVNRSMTPILSATFAPPITTTNGCSGLLEDAVERLELGCQEQSGRARQEVRHTGRRRVGAVHGAERVAHEDVGQRRQLGRERRVVLLLARVEAQVLEQAHRPLLAVEGDRLAEELGQALGDGPQRQLGPHLALRPAEVRADDHLRAVLAQVPNRRERRPDARVVGDPVAVERDVQVRANEDPPALDGQVAHGLHSTFWTRSARRHE